MKKTAYLLSIVTFAVAWILFAEIARSDISKFDDVVYVRTPTRIEISSYLPRAAEFGDWVGNWTSDKGSIEVGGSYSASWRKVDGAWKIQSEIFVTLFCKGPACQV